jgi:deoxyadenosine/deoxycytidine kinase
VQALGVQLQARTYHEPVSENPYFADYQEDPHRWAFHAQVGFFYQSLLSSLAVSRGAPQDAVQDRGPHEMLAIFGTYHLEHGNMTSREYQLLATSLARAEPLLSTPDLLLFLSAPVSELDARIRARRRPSEALIPIRYLARLDEAYAQFIREWNRSELVVIDTMEIDSRNEHGAQLLASVVSDNLHGRRE